MNGFDRSNFFEPVPYRVYLRDDGKRASIHGAVPWVSDAEKPRWTTVTAGYTVFHKVSGTYGIGRKPWDTLEQCQAWINGTGGLPS